jgi:hypothetical protein
MSTIAGKAYHPVNGATEEIWEGFSWPCLFFGSLWCAYKGMWGWGVASFVLAVCTFGISWAIFPFFANALHANSLLKRGYLNATQWNGRKQASSRASSHSSAQIQGGSFVADELSKLANLRDHGVLSDEEFDRQKQKLLS